MNLVITMAGKYTRFKEAGYNLPKYLLPWGDRSILSEIIDNLQSYALRGNIFLVANKEDEPFMGHVRKIMDAHSIPRKNLLLVGDTSGQAETALKAVQHFYITGPVLFHNADTILYRRNIWAIEASLAKLVHGFIDVFKSNNHAYSYVVEKEGRVSMISEKVLVSDLATSGLYGFGETRDFLDYYRDGQIYISEIYKEMIADGRDVCIGKAYDEKDTIVLGTPQDYLKHSAGV